jgi:DnaJ-class molecular chaperone
LQRAKDLHPDLKAGFTAADGEAFLSLVTAYEVLSDPQQRQLYDIASNSKLPGALKRAAAAAAAAADGSGSGESDATEASGSAAGGPIVMVQCVNTAAC